MEKCQKCFYKSGNSCRVMTKQFISCWAKADEKEGNKRELAILVYNNTRLNKI